MQTNDTLATRLPALEDREAIRALKAFYARCADTKYTDDHRRLPQEEIDVITRRQVDATFTEDAVWDGGPQFGRREGREAIYDHLRAGGWNFALHYFVSPVVEVAGDTAHASWMLWQPCTLAAGNRSMLMSATTDDDYVSTDAGWRMRFMRFTLKFITPLERPWSLAGNAGFSG